MTTDVLADRPALRRALAATQLQVLNLPAALAWMWTILATSWVINIAIFGILHDRGVPAGFTGGLASIYVVVLIMFTQLVVRGFPFAIGFSLSRRAFAWSVLALALLIAAGNGIAVWLLSVVERGTDGWGVRVPFFGVRSMATGNPASQVLVYAVPFLLVALIGALIGATIQRWGSAGLWIGVILMMLLAGGVIALISYQDGWPVVGDWLARSSRLALFAGWPALASLPIGAAAYLVIRRAAPA